MPKGQTNRILQHLNRVVLQEENDAQADANLLGRFLAERDEAAFEALLRRHGPMVLNVCRRVLRHAHDADDAFQATFLVLVRKAASIGKRNLLANWLYGVAYRTALEARSLKARRREVQVDEMPQIEVRQENSWQEIEPYLDQELHRLPDKYRLPIVLCDLEGKTQKEVAEMLGWPEGTVSGRLFRGREMLARRMARYGLTVSAGTVAGAFAGQIAIAGLPVPLVASTVRVVASMVGKQALDAGVISPQVAALTEGVLRAMLMTKIKNGVTILLVLGILGLGAGWITHSAQAQRQSEVARADVPEAAAAKAEDERPVKNKPSKEAIGAQVKIAEANVEVARMNVEVAKAQAEEAAVVFGIAEREEQARRATYSRLETVAKNGGVDRATLEDAKTAYEKAKGETQAKKVAYRVALARVKVAEAQVKVAEAQVMAARIGS